ncbi:tyrosyl-tRNA synthetase [Enteropsectra breve]|nr:tyrosyl-tRNA synthetase [Enteropsectra breve]
MAISKAFLSKTSLADVINGEKVCESKERMDICWPMTANSRLTLGDVLLFMDVKDFIDANCNVKILLQDLHGFLEDPKTDMEKQELKTKYYMEIVKLVFKGMGISDISFKVASEHQFQNDFTFDIYRISSYTTVEDALQAGKQPCADNENGLLSTLLYANMMALDAHYARCDAVYQSVRFRRMFEHANKFLPKLSYEQQAFLLGKDTSEIDFEKYAGLEELLKIDLLDTKKQISNKIKKCFCEPGNSSTGVLGLIKFMVFPLLSRKIIAGSDSCIEINNRKYANFEDLEKAYSLEEIHPGDLKNALAECIEGFVSSIRNGMQEHEELIKKAFK